MIKRVVDLGGVVMGIAAKILSNLLSKLLKRPITIKPEHFQIIGAAIGALIEIFGSVDAVVKHLTRQTQLLNRVKDNERMKAKARKALSDVEPVLEKVAQEG